MKIPSLASKVTQTFWELTGTKITDKELDYVLNHIPDDVRLNLQHHITPDGGLKDLSLWMSNWRRVKKSLRKGSSTNYKPRDSYEKQFFFSNIFKELVGGTSAEEWEYIQLTESMPSYIQIVMEDPNSSEYAVAVFKDWMKNQDTVKNRRAANGLEELDIELETTIREELVKSEFRDFDRELKESLNGALNKTMMRYFGVDVDNPVLMSFTLPSGSSFEETPPSCPKCEAEKEHAAKLKKREDESECMIRIIAIVNSSSMSQDDSDELMGEISNLQKILKGEMK